MKNTFFALVLSLLVLSCSTSPTTPTENGVQGKWLWIESIGGFTGNTKLVPEPGTSRIVEFKNDGTYIEYQDGILSSSLKYEIVQERSGSREEIVDVIRFFGVLKSSSRIRTVNSDTLLLDETQVEGFSLTYLRVR